LGSGIKEQLIGSGFKGTAVGAPENGERVSELDLEFFLWCAGEIAIFNRSHYEDVLITRVNGWIDAAECKRRYRQINDFEKMLAETGTTILKFYLHISKDEQKKRLEERRDTAEKQWKFQPGDLAVREQWDDYMGAYEAALSATSTAHAPWHVIPANNNLARNLMVSSLLIETLDNLKMRYPEPVPGVAEIKIV